MINPNILINNQLVLLLDHNQLKTMFIFCFTDFINKHERIQIIKPVVQGTALE